MEMRNHSFTNRKAAGVELARALKQRKLQPPLTVLGLPRGGVPVAYEVARALGAPLDVIVVRKIGMPGQPEFAIGAIAPGGIIVREPDPSAGFGNPDPHFDRLVLREQRELARREHEYRAGGLPLDLRGKTTVLVDDGLATGATMLAAIRAARRAGAARVIVAAPVASTEAATLTSQNADGTVFLETSADLASISQWYADFAQVTDAEVRALLEHGDRHGPFANTGSVGAA
jgi:predicted phosphoribosyltransferase